MIIDFLDFLLQNGIAYRVTNGYREIFKDTDGRSDYDILLKKVDFHRIESIVENFGSNFGYSIVQIYHQSVLAKNIFVYNKITDNILNLDFYGEMVRHQIKIFDEDDAFSSERIYKGVNILSPHHEFIQYFIKKIDKLKISQEVFGHLRKLYLINELECSSLLQNFFPKNKEMLQRAFQENGYTNILENIMALKLEFMASRKSSSSFTGKNGLRLINRLHKRTGLAIAFLGPDGAGKSTIINGLLNEELPFRRTDYFHLKPLKKITSNTQAVSDPHASAPYSMPISYIKLIFFLIQYNLGWVKNIIELKIKSSLIFFDRYYDDLLVDPKRYRLGATGRFAFAVRYFIPKPDIFFILTADPEVIHKRKQEVTLPELKRQILEYGFLADNKRYFCVNVDRDPDEIVIEIKQIIMTKMHERY